MPNYVRSSQKLLTFIVVLSLRIDWSICHIVVKLAVQTLPLKIDEFLVNVFYYIHNSTKCVSTLQEYADFCNVEFKHCETLRLSVTRALERTLEYVGSISVLFQPS